MRREPVLRRALNRLTAAHAVIDSVEVYGEGCGADSVTGKQLPSITAIAVPQGSGSAMDDEDVRLTGQPGAAFSGTAPWPILPAATEAVVGHG